MVICDHVVVSFHAYYCTVQYLSLRLLIKQPANSKRSQNFGRALWSYQVLEENTSFVMMRNCINPAYGYYGSARDLLVASEPNMGVKHPTTILLKDIRT
jgi:hypothetical protein